MDNSLLHYDRHGMKNNFAQTISFTQGNLFCGPKSHLSGNFNKNLHRDPNGESDDLLTV